MGRKPGTIRVLFQAKNLSLAIIAWPLVNSEAHIFNERTEEYIKFSEYF